MIRQKGGIGFIDFKKAYDTVERAWLWTTMKVSGFSDKQINRVKSLAEKGVTKVVINGVDSQCIDLKRGVCQGCSMSPTLFALVTIGLEAWARSVIRGVRMEEVV